MLLHVQIRGGAVGSGQENDGVSPRARARAWAAARPRRSCGPRAGPRVREREGGDGVEGGAVAGPLWDEIG
jgi:hypothetical protein